MKTFFLVLVLLAAGISGEGKVAVGVERLLVENMENPSVIERTSPRLSWNLVSSARSVKQEAYRIIVSSSPQKAQKAIGDIWDSGRVDSEGCILIQYGGPVIKQNTRVFWRVKAYTNRGESDWSETATWATGLYSFKAWNAQWIGLESLGEGDNPVKGHLAARYLRKEFSVEGKEISRATAFICGLGWYDLYLNGTRVGEQQLCPAPTDYRNTQLYNSFDVTSMIQGGTANAAGVILGNGRYFAMRQHKPYKNNSFGFPKLLFTLIIEYADGSRSQISSDRNWKVTAKGPITASNEYDGEDYDARLEMQGWDKAGFNDAAWSDADRTAIPSGTLRPMMQPFIKVMKSVKPIACQRLADGRYILDMGQNMAGWLRFKVKGEKGDTITLRFAETLLKDGGLSTANLRDARAMDTYILSGKEGGEEWRPRFTYHGFRYVEVGGWHGELSLDDFSGEVLYDDMETIGHFECDEPVLNDIVRNAGWGIASNYKGMPVDCPQRNERQPWLGDRIQGSLGESYLFANEAFYDKWVDDILEAQRFDGSIPDVAPAFWNYYSDNMTWPSALPFACEMLYDRWGNIEPMRRSYSAIKRWLRYMKDEYMGEDFIVSKDSYGDWCMPPESPEIIHSKDSLRITDPGLIGTSFYCKMLEVMTRFATLTGHDEDVEAFGELREKMRNAINDRYLHSDGHYSNGTVTANLLPLVFGLVPQGREDEVCSHIIGKISADGFNTSCGVLGTQWQLTELTRRGYSDVAFAIATATDYPSWGYMVGKGATTIWELYNGDTADSAMNSGNHVMLIGDLLSWCFGDLGGIKPLEPAFRRISIAPSFDIDALGSVDASFCSASGLIASRWKRESGTITWKVEIPAGTSARLYFPCADASLIMEGGKSLKRCRDVSIQDSSEGSVILEAGSGSYDFKFTYHDAGKSGIVSEGLIYRTAPFPQCHAATLAELSDGRIGAAWFGGTREGADDVCIWYSVKNVEDGTWSIPVMAGDGTFADSPRRPCGNPVLWQSPDGPLTLFFKVGKHVSEWEGFYVTSEDGGTTWSERRSLPKDFIGPVKNKPLMYGDRLIAPSSLEDGGWRLHFELSDDLGKTWRSTGDIAAEDAVQTMDGSMGPIQAIQPSVIEMPNGSLRAYCRSRSGLMAVSDSRDGGENWSKVTLCDLPSNNSGADAVRLKDGRYLMVYNKVRTAAMTKKGARTPLNLAISDDGVHWFDALVLEDSPISQYSYPCIICGSNGMVHIAYTWRRLKIKYTMIDPATLDKGGPIHFE